MILILYITHLNLSLLPVKLQFINLIFISHYIRILINFKPPTKDYQSSLIGGLLNYP